MGIQGFDWGILKDQQREAYANLEKRSIGIGREIAQIRTSALEGRGLIATFIFDKILKPFGIGDSAKQIKTLSQEQHQIEKLLKTVPDKLIWSQELKPLQGLGDLIKSTQREIDALNKRGVGLNKVLSRFEAQLAALKLIQSVSDKVVPKIPRESLRASPAMVKELKARVSMREVPDETEEDSLSPRVKNIETKIQLLKRQLEASNALDIDPEVSHRDVDTLARKLLELKSDPTEQKVRELEHSLGQVETDSESEASFEDLVDDADLESELEVPEHGDFGIETSTVEEFTVPEISQSKIKFINPSQNPIDDLLEKIHYSEQKYQKLKAKVLEDNSGLARLIISPKAKETLALLRKEKEGYLQQLHAEVHAQKQTLGPEKFRQLENFVNQKMNEEAKVLEQRIIRQLTKGERSELLEQEVVKSTTNALRATLSKISLSPNDLDKTGREGENVFKEFDSNLVDADRKITMIGYGIAAKLLAEPNHKKRQRAKESLCKSAVAFARSGNYIAAGALFAALNSEGLMRPQSRGYETPSESYNEGFRELQSLFGTNTQARTIQDHAKGNSYIPTILSIKQIADASKQGLSLGNKLHPKVKQNILSAVNAWKGAVDSAQKDESLLTLEGGLFNNIPSTAKNVQDHLIGLADKVAPRR